MPQEEIGYVKLEWTCKTCGSKNPGTSRTCVNCGAPMSSKDEFQAPAQQVLITDEAEIAKAKIGPDIACAFCGTRNSADRKVCLSCGANLGEGTARTTGEVVGALKTDKAPDVLCPSCHKPNPATALKCQSCGYTLAQAKPPPAPMPAPTPATAAPTADGKRGWLTTLLFVGGLVLMCACGLGLFYLIGQTTETTAVVQSVSWERQIAIQALQPVKRDTWEDQIPSEGQKGSCEKRVRETRDAPAPGAERVCGTPYLKDQGNGTAKVVQDCQYKLSANWCEYTVQEWRTLDNRLVAKGNDLSPQWPAVRLASGQREGDRQEIYRITFNANGQAYTYTPSALSEYQRFAPNSRWVLEINGLGGISRIRPAQ